MTVVVASGATNSENFNLNAGSRLTHVSISPSGTGIGPIRVFAGLIQPRVDNNIQTRLTGGWIRGAGTNPSNAHDLIWDGDLEIDTDMALRVSGRNDGDAARTFLVNFVVIE